MSVVGPRRPARRRVSDSGCPSADAVPGTPTSAISEAADRQAGRRRVRMDSHEDAFLSSGHERSSRTSRRVSAAVSGSCPCTATSATTSPSSTATSRHGSDVGVRSLARASRAGRVRFATSVPMAAPLLRPAQACRLRARPVKNARDAGRARRSCRAPRSPSRRGACSRPRAHGRAPASARRRAQPKGTAVCTISCGLRASDGVPLPA